MVREWEEDAVGGLNESATYLLGPSGPMYRRPANAADVRWYVYDGLGSVVGEVDVNGLLIAEKKHDVFGLRRGTVGTEKSRHGFVGGLGHYSDDETELVYMRARYYDPATGRFISEDPAKHGNNWFEYCNNDPVNKVDQNGQAPHYATDLTAILGLITAIGALGQINKDNEFFRPLFTAWAMTFLAESVALWGIGVFSSFGPAAGVDICAYIGAVGAGTGIIGTIQEGATMSPAGKIGTFYVGYSLMLSASMVLLDIEVDIATGGQFLGE